MFLENHKTGVCNLIIESDLEIIKIIYYSKRNCKFVKIQILGLNNKLRE